MQHHRRALVSMAAASLVASALVSASPPASAASGTFTQSAPITVAWEGSGRASASSTDPITPDADGEASQLSLSAPSGADAIVVRLRLEVDHPSMDDLDVVLSAPDGRTVVLASDVGGPNPIDGSLHVATYTTAGPAEPFDDESISAGDTRRPADYDTTPNDVDAFADTAPADLDALAGAAATGAGWTLTAYDDTAGNVGSLTGWSIQVSYGLTASPSPSTLSVSGQPSAVTDVDLVLRDVDDEYLGDTEVLLESPDGRYAHVLSVVGVLVQDADLTLDDEAVAAFPVDSAAPSGSYRPRSVVEVGELEPIGGVESSDIGASLSVFDGGAANGTWRLWVFKESCCADSHIGSWSLQITTTDPPAQPAIDTAPPVLSDVALAPRRLPTGMGARLRVASTEAAKLVGQVQRRKDGEWRRAGTKRWSLRAGANTRLFYGKTAQGRLRSGRYRVLLVATDAAGNASAEVRRRFRVDRG